MSKGKFEAGIRGITPEAFQNAWARNAAPIQPTPPVDWTLKAGTTSALDVAALTNPVAVYAGYGEYRR